MGYYFCVNKKISRRERSHERFGSSEHKVLPRNKNLKQILSYDRKGSRGR